MTGLVVKSTGSWYWVRTEDGKQYQCRIRGKFRIKGIKDTNPVAVGDRVDFIFDEKLNTGVITSIHDRKNYIVRRSVNLSKQTHIIAANIDQAFLMITIDQPPTLPAFIDRFLATAEAYDVTAILLFNKIDLYDTDLQLKKDEMIRIYRNIGYLCIEISATKGIGIDKVKQLMPGKVSLFSGHSGVGKSTLINAIAPHLNLKTAEISKQHKQGIHTTTFAELFVIQTKPESYVIDTPGIKGFGIADLDPKEVSDFFPEFLNLKPHCKFNNCMHINEPHCAVKAALEKGEIAPSRYRSYLQIVSGDEENYRTNDYSI